MNDSLNLSKNLFGCKSVSELYDQAASPRHFAGAERFVAGAGAGRGNEIIQARAGGLRFDVNVSRGFDIGMCEYHGIPVSWTSVSGHVSPAFYDFRGRNWDRGFEGGMMATCGLQHVGNPETSPDGEIGLHGRSSYIPAEVTECSVTYGGEPCVLLRGCVREAQVGGDVLALYRTIRAPLFGDRISVEDKVVNEGGTHAVHMMLYHVNMGFPLLSETTRIGQIDAARELVAGGADVDAEDYARVKFEDGAQPNVILHTNKTPGKAQVRVENTVQWMGRPWRLALTIGYDREQCPFLTQWRHFGKSMRVLAFEPGNASTRGMEFHRKDGTLCVLAPGESRQYNIDLTFDMEL